MRLAGADRLPYDFTGLADTVSRYVDELQKLLKDRQEEARERDRELDEGLFRVTADPKRPTNAPPRLDVPPHLGFAPLQNAAEALTAAAKRYEKAIQKRAGGDEVKGPALSRLNATLIQAEHKLTSPSGLPGRPWFQHLIYAPGQYTGYGVKTLPGVREAIEQKRWAQADEQIVRAAAALEEEARLVESAAELVEKGQ